MLGSVGVRIYVIRLKIGFYSQIAFCEWGSFSFYNGTRDYFVTKTLLKNRFANHFVFFFSFLPCHEVKGAGEKRFSHALSDDNYYTN